MLQDTFTLLLLCYLIGVGFGVTSIFHLKLKKHRKVAKECPAENIVNEDPPQAETVNDINQSLKNEEEYYGSNSSLASSRSVQESYDHQVALETFAKINGFACDEKLLSAVENKMSKTRIQQRSYVGPKYVNAKEHFQVCSPSAGNSNDLCDRNYPWIKYSNTFKSRKKKRFRRVRRFFSRLLCLRKVLD